MFTSAKFLKFRGTSDSGWLRFKLGSCGAVGNAFVLLCDSSYAFGVVDNFVFYSFICASKSILFIDVEKLFQKIYVDCSSLYIHYSDEHVLIPALHWSSFCYFSNPLCIPLKNTVHETERSKLDLFRLTTALTPRQFTHIGYEKILKTFTAPRANVFSFEYYDHNIIRPNQDQSLDDDKFANPHLTEIFFIQTPYIFSLKSLDKKHDHIISEALIDIQTYESFHDKFQTFPLTFHFLTPKERDLHCSLDIMLRTKQTHTYTYYKFIQNHFNLHTPSRQPHHRFQLISPMYTSPFFLNFTYCIKGTNFQGILRNTTQ